jgi:hypothetical protein
MAKTKSENKPKKNTKSINKVKKTSKGLGDTVEKIFKATKVDKVAKWVLGEDCGCEERKETLNKLFPYRQPKCLLEEEYNYLDKYFTERRNQVNAEIQRELVKINNRVFSENFRATSCSSCFLNSIHNKLEKIYNKYKDEK